VLNLGVIRTLFNRSDVIMTTKNDRESEQTHLKRTLGMCGYKEWTCKKALQWGPSQKKTPAFSIAPEAQWVNVPLLHIRFVREAHKCSEVTE
jgi:hypothetical protein